MNQEPNFYCVIPTEILTDARLNSTSKILYGLITSMTSRTGYCWATNKYLSECLNESERTTTRCLQQLKECEYVYCEMFNNNERHLYIKKPLYFERQYSTKPELLEDVKKAVDETPYHDIVDLFNDIFKGTNDSKPYLPLVAEITPKRQKALRARFKEHPDLDWWYKFFMRVKASPFLLGITTSWKASFDWLMNPTNMTKVIEGNYDDKGINTPTVKKDVVELKWQEFCRNLGRGQQDPVLKKVASKMDTYNMRRMSPSQLQFQRNGFVSLYNNFLQEVTA